MLHVKSKLAVTAATGLLSLGGGGLGVALVNSSHAALPVITISHTAAVPSVSPPAPVASGAAAAGSTASSVTDGDTVQSGDQTTPDTPGSASIESTVTGSETAAPSDGPGGHADAPGDIQHIGGAGEQ
jgi:hypothetical protein